MNQQDVFIIGASIAGCTAAILFARRGLKVALIERNPDLEHYKKMCTHFIQASATPTIQRLRLAEKIEAAGGIRNAVNIWTRWGWIVDTLDDGKHPAYGYNIRRSVLDPMLRKLAIETPGVDFMPGVAGDKLLEAGGRFSGVEVIDKNGGKREMRARLVVAADGRHSRIANLSGANTARKAHNRFAYFAHYRGLQLSSGKRSQMWFLEPDLAYTFPNEDDVTVVACMPSKDKLPAWKNNPEECFERFVGELLDGPRLGEATRVSQLYGIVDMTNTTRPAAHNGLAFIGDAAMANDPLWGVGCGWAFQSAEWLVESTADALVQHKNLDSALARYRKKHKTELAGHEILISDYATARPFNAIEKLMYSAAARDKALAHNFLLFGQRSIGVLQFLSPRAMARSAWVNMTWKAPAQPSREQAV
ncbi:MAG TPA: NAD(P)/FAD-dependent oxidoreductase [Burkholderiales bacterium]|nr:NAD(P)/FAD-dependent oxidoreductase [Burkholderiales bacterium]